jgi:3-hydroxyacyl-[acyl-carrier-protein] dehydratase
MDNSEMSTMELVQQQIMELIPHRHPFLLLDGMVDVAPGISGTGIKALSEDESSYESADCFMVPAALIIENMAQTAAVVLASAKLSATPAAASKDEAVFLATLKSIRFFQPVTPGKTLRCHVVVDRKFRNMATVHCETKVDHEVIATGSMVLGTSES